MPDLSVLIPTTGRRAKLLGQVFDVLHEVAPDAEILVLEGMSWGAALNKLAERATGAYWSCCCDDTAPHPGAYEAGIAMLETGVMPASRYLTVNGEPLRPGWDDAPHGTDLDWCRSFLLTPAIFAQVGPFIDATWYADIDYSERLVKAGWPIVACDGFAFTHLDGERDWLTDEELKRQAAEYEESHRRQGIAV